MLNLPLPTYPNGHAKCWLNHAPPDAQNPDAAQGEWKLCADWLTPGEELERDEFDHVLDYILASDPARSFDIFR